MVMKKEKSCGAVVFRREKDGLVFLVETMALGHISLPKGHVENGETEEETAHREIREETGLDVRIDTRFRHTITYSPRPGVEKDVVFFAAEAEAGDITPQPEEVRKAAFLPMDEAMRILTYASDREVLRAAGEYLDAETPDCRRGRSAPLDGRSPAAK